MAVSSKSAFFNLINDKLKEADVKAKANPPRPLVCLELFPDIRVSLCFVVNISLNISTSIYTASDRSEGLCQHLGMEFRARG